MRGRELSVRTSAGRLPYNPSVGRTAVRRFTFGVVMRISKSLLEHRVGRGLMQASMLGLGLSLAACGGGGGDDTVVTPPPPAPTVKLTLRGQVVDSPIAMASVTATIGSRSFNATADASGNYSLDVEVPESAAGGFVTLNATGVGAQSFVALTSLAGSLSSLVANAGGDGVLTAQENFATQVTNVSTAEAVLLEQANGGAITSEAQRQAAATEINGVDVLELATALKLAIDSATDYPLPAGQANTLALARNATARTQFIEDAKTEDPETFRQTQTQVAQDPAVTPPAATGTPASLLAAVLSTDAGFTFNFSNRVKVFDFNASGSGSYSASDGTTATTWVLDGSTIAVSYDTPVETVSFDIENCNGTVRQVEAHYLSEGVSLNKLSQRTLAVTTDFHITYPDCPSLAARDLTETSALTLLVAGDFQALTAADVNGSQQTLQLIDPVQGTLASDLATFNANGTGSTRLLGQSFTWALLPDGRGVSVTYGNGAQGSYRILRALDGVAADGFFDLRSGDERLVDAGASISVDPADPIVVTAEAVPGRYYQFGIGNEQVADSGLKGFRLRFDVGGTGSQEDDFRNGQGAVVTVDSGNTPVSFFRWTVDATANAVAVERRYGDTGGYQCQPADAGCGLFDSRTIFPLAVEGTRYYWIERRRVAPAGQFVSAQTPTTYLSRFYDFEPLAATAKSGHSTARSSLASAAGESQR